MPKALEEKLQREVAGKNWSEDRKNAYIYSTMRKTGWKPKKKKKMSKNSHYDEKTVKMAMAMKGGEKK